MAEQFMAHLGPSYVESNHFGENNAVKYKINLRGTNYDSTTNVSYMRINENDVMATFTRGLNAVTIDTNGNPSNPASFDIYGRPEHLDTLRTYLMSAPSNRLVLLVSWDAMKSSRDFDDFMEQYGAVSWPGIPFLNKTPGTYHRSSYAAIFNTTMKRFCYENFVGNTPGKVENTSADLEAVFDIIEDIGACGIPDRKVDDINEYFSKPGDYQFKRYAGADPITDYSEIYHIKCELCRDQELIDAGGRSVLYVWSQLLAGKWTSQLLLTEMNGEADKWYWHEGYYRMPDPSSGAELWGSAVYRWPSSVTVGKAGCRNVTITRVTRDNDDKIANAAFGVNGVRTNGIVDSDEFSNPVMQLLNLKPKNLISSNNIKERV